MNKKELTLFLKDLETVRDILTPDQILLVPNIFPKIPTDKDIKKGDRFNVDGKVLEAAADFKKEDIDKLKLINPINKRR